MKMKFNYDSTEKPLALKELREIAPAVMNGYSFVTVERFRESLAKTSRASLSGRPRPSATAGLCPAARIFPETADSWNLWPKPPVPIGDGGLGRAPRRAFVLQPAYSPRRPIPGVFGQNHSCHSVMEASAVRHARRASSCRPLLNPPPAVRWKTPSGTLGPFTLIFGHSSPGLCHSCTGS